MKFFKLATAAIALVLSTSANASLIGDTVDFVFYYQDETTPFGGASHPSHTFDATVVAGETEYSYYNWDPAVVAIDIEANYMELSIGNGGISFCDPCFITIEGINDTITGIDVTLTQGGYGISDMTIADITFGEHSVTFGVGGSQYGGFVAHVDLTTVPVPAAVWLFGSGLVGLAAFARRKKA